MVSLLAERSDFKLSPFSLFSLWFFPVDSSRAWEKASLYAGMLLSPVVSMTSVSSDALDWCCSCSLVLLSGESVSPSSASSSLSRESPLRDAISVVLLLLPSRCLFVRSVDSLLLLSLLYLLLLLEVEGWSSRMRPIFLASSITASSSSSSLSSSESSSNLETLESGVEEVERRLVSELVDTLDVWDKAEEEGWMEPPLPPTPPVPKGRWVFMWRLSLLAWEQACGHRGHLNGFSPVWERLCTIKLLWNRKPLPQNSQDLSFPDGSMCCFVLDSAPGVGGSGVGVGVRVRGEVAEKLAEGCCCGGCCCCWEKGGVRVGAGGWWGLRRMASGDVWEGLLVPASCRRRCE